MKHIRLLLSVSLVLLIGKPAKAQTFFEDSTYYFVYQDAYSLTPGLDFGTYCKELLRIDSIGDMGEYYTVERTPYKPFWGYDSLTYKLRVFNDKVYLSGFLTNNNNDSFEINDLLIYDFTLDIGDTMFVSDTLSGLYYGLILDTIVDITYLDGISRETFYWSVIDPHNEFNNIKLDYTVKGIGSNRGLVYFELLVRRTGWQGLVSACKDNTPIYLNNPTHYPIDVEDACNEDTIRSRVISVEHIISIPLKIYPNPAQTELFLQEIPLHSAYRILNVVGAEVTKGVYEGNAIPVSALPQGVYLLQIQTQEQVWQARFVKE
ncbi:MAG: T9SS type A sorting domain-containing protein [Bacteroidia bacterium]|nr:T9SS type A sorting domain-containing protein [Bacteroidia bacterium]